MFTNKLTGVVHNNQSSIAAISNAEINSFLDYDAIFDHIAKRFNKAPTIEHKCHNCGGALEIKTNDGIFKCPYCKSCYAIGTNKINWRY